jgi:hypothetical protein
VAVGAIASCRFGSAWARTQEASLALGSHSEQTTRAPAPGAGSQ